MWISQGNTKLGRMPNVSLRPVRDCPNCTSCASKCYARKAYRQYPGTRDAWDGNSKDVRGGEDWQSDVTEFLLRRRNPVRFFRVHVAGDFVSRKYAREWADLAREFPETRFLAFTKAFHEIKNVDFPPNFQLVYSAFPGMKIPAGQRVAYAGEPADYTGRDRAKAERALVCPGHCDSCGLCWSLASIRRDVRFPIH